MEAKDYENAILASYKAGIKLVVDWLKENSWDDDGVQCFIPTDWQDQVKEWEYGQE